MLWSEITIQTSSRTQFVDVTRLVSEALSRSGVKNGLCYAYVPHTTAGVTINENADPDVVTDILNALEKLVPVNGNYSHAEGNSDAHLKASIMGFSQMIPVIGGKPALGSWQGIYFCEFDGPRKRRMLVGVIGE